MKYQKKIECVSESQNKHLYSAHYYMQLLFDRFYAFGSYSAVKLLDCRVNVE